ncbi:MAG: CHASE domain-containing protein, partial [Verrucomicrobia bacterium]|nr:CHASE domain-containing protein [Verrucomicrobiota bacterium]
MSLVLLAGLWTARQSGETADLQMRRELVRQVTAVAATIDPAQIKTLSFTAEDATRPVFRILSSQMAAYAESAKLPCLYTLALRDRKLIAGPGTSSSALPGTVQQNPGPKDMEVFVTARPQVLGPDGDEDGTFVRALAPVIHPSTGEVLMLVCIDVKADAWRALVRKAQWAPGEIALVLLLVLFLSELVFRYRHYAGFSQSGYMETASCAVFLTGLSLAAATYFHRLERDMRRNTFYSLAQERAAVSVAEFNNLNSMLDQLGCFFEARNSIFRDEFGTYCKKIMQSGVMQRCLWIPAVPEAEVPAFVQTVRGTGITNFSIWQKTSDGGREPASARPVHYPVLYTEPPGTGLILGYDEFSDLARGDAIRRALDSGLSMATDPVRLMTTTNPALAFLIFKPVDSAANKGMAALAVYPDNLLGSSSRRTGRRNDLEICLSQLEFGKPRLLMAGSSDQCVRECWADLKPELNMDVPIFRFGKTYVLRLVPENSWLAANPLHSGWQVGGLGMLFTLLASSLVALITNRQRVLEKNVNLRTAELKESEAKFRAIIECSPVPMALNDAQQNITFANSACIKAFGYKLEEIPTLTDWWPKAYPDSAYRQWVLETWQARIAQAEQTGEEFQPFEVRITCKDGSTKTVLASAASITRSFEDTHLIVLYDITDRKQAEDVLRKTKNLLTETGKMGKVGAWEFDIETGEQIWTEEVYRIHEVDSTLHPTVEQGVHFYTPKSRPVIERAVQRLVEKGEPYDLELEIITAKGNLRSVHTIAKPDLSHRRVFGFFQDITDRKQAEEALRASTQITEGILNTMPIRVFWKDMDLVYLGCNQVFARDAGFNTPQEIVGKDD